MGILMKRNVLLAVIIFVVVLYNFRTSGMLAPHTISAVGGTVLGEGEAARRLAELRNLSWPTVDNHMGLRYLHKQQFPAGGCHDRKFVVWHASAACTCLCTLS
jgi:hypothetical protein